MMHATHDG